MPSMMQEESNLETELRVNLKKEEVEFTESEQFKKEALIAYCILFCLGVGNLLPFHAFITAHGYFAEKLCDTQFKNSFESFFSMFYTASQPVGLVMAMQYKNSISIRGQVHYPLLLYSIVFSFATVCVGIAEIKGNALFSLTLISITLCGWSGAVMNGGLFGLAGILPTSTTAALMIGQGMAGLLVSLVNLITSASAPPTIDCSDDVASADDGSCNSNSVNYGALAFFAVTSVVLFLCIALWRVLMQLRYINHFIILNSKQTARKYSDYVENPLTRLDALKAAAGHGPESVERAPYLPSIDSRPEPTTRNSESSLTLSAGTANINAYKDTTRDTTLSTLHLSLLSNVLRVLRILRIPAFSVCLTFTISLSVFPAVMVLVQSTKYCSDSGNRLYTDLWTPFLFVLFNLFDFIGRVSAQLHQRHTCFTADNIWIGASFRLVLPVLILFCNVSDSQLPVLFRNDAATIILFSTLAISNGYIGNLSMMFGPTLVTSEDASLAGTIMVFSLTFGLLFGALISFLMVFILVGR